MKMQTEATTGRYFFVRQERSNVRVWAAEICFIEARKNYCMFFLRNGRKLLVLVRMKQLDFLLQEFGFCRVHRAFLVNLDWIAAFDRHQVRGDDGQTIPIGEHYADILPGRVPMIIDNYPELSDGAEKKRGLKRRRNDRPKIATLALSGDADGGPSCRFSD